jgi:ketosteroid isomerase-like protein
MMFNRFHFVVVLMFIISLSACFLPKRKDMYTNEKDKAALLQADKDFATLSVSAGTKAAYLEYIDSNGVLLKPDIVPIAGADAVDYIIALKDDGYKMYWKPNSATVAISGELGYTYGTYELEPTKKDTVFYGTYVSIWKKQADGKWKFVLHSENEGIGE